jgi:glycosyltransferase involved in cell wall biosynthesis
MHIVHTESSCGWGGQEMRIVAEAEGLARRGHRLTIVAPAHASILPEAVARGLRAIALPIAKKRPRALWAMRRFLAANDIDVVNTHSSTDSWLVALARASLGRAPALVRTRHVSSPVGTDPMTRWLYVRAPDHVVVTGERLRATLASKLGADPARITSIPTGIDLARFVPGDRDAARAAHGLAATTWIGVLAALRNWKGHTYLLDALRALVAKGRELSLLVIGDGPQRANLERYVAAIGLVSRVRFIGHQPDPEAWLPALDVFVLPSYGDEGVSQAVMQAMACALPIVVTDVGAINDAVTHEASGLVVAPRDAGVLADAIARLLDDASLRERLAREARAKAARDFGVDRMLDRMQAVFERAIAEHRH